MVFDHEGKIYEDVEAMCAAYNINPGTFTSRIRSKHWNLQSYGIIEITNTLQSTPDHQRIQTRCYTTFTKE